MPNYHYLCELCSHEFETYQSIKAESLRDCPECKTENLNRVFHAVNAFVRSDNPTIGTLAERNTAKLGTYGREAFWEKQKTNKANAYAAARKELQIPDVSRESIALNKKIQNMNDQQKERYIQEGKI